MFYCDPCRTRNKWPESFAQSAGRCEICAERAICNDIPSRLLPRDKAVKPATLTLHAHELLSKWGFDDGDPPQHILDYAHTVEIDFRDLIPRWDAVLRALVRQHLLPALAANGHQVEAYDIGGCHNPIRASRVDGIEIDDYDWDNNRRIPLTPESVVVQWSDIIRAFEAAR